MSDNNIDELARRIAERARTAGVPKQQACADRCAKLQEYLDSLVRQRTQTILDLDALLTRTSQHFDRLENTRLNGTYKSLRAYRYDDQGKPVGNKPFDFTLHCTVLGGDTAPGLFYLHRDGALKLSECRPELVREMHVAIELTATRVIRPHDASHAFPGFNPPRAYMLGQYSEVCTQLELWLLALVEIGSITPK